MALPADYVAAGLIACLVLFLVNHYGFIQVVKTHPAVNPAKFATPDGKTTTIQQLIDAKIPGLQNNAFSFMNPLLWSGQLQTMFAGVRKFRWADRLYFGREIVVLSDGGSAALDRVISLEQFSKLDAKDVHTPKGQPHEINPCTRYLSDDEIKSSDDDRPMVIALHGLSGSSAEAYCRCLLRRLADEGFDCFVLNSRGCGNVKLTSPTLFCALWTQDIREVVKRLRKRHPNRKLYCVGFSLGSIILTNYLAQEGADSQVDFAVTLACIWDLKVSSLLYENGFISGSLYSPVMTVPLKNLLHTHKDELEGNPNFKANYNPETLRKVYKLRSFDDLFTSQMFGFSCAEDYYMNASPVNRIHKIRTPIVNINAADDPIAGGPDSGAIPLSQAKHNPYLHLILTNLGGHLGWFKWNNVRWYADPVSKLFVEVNKLGACTVDEGALPRSPLEDDRLQ